MALVKELVELHHGEISVNSVENGETSFAIFLPMGREHFLIRKLLKESKDPEEDKENQTDLSEIKNPHPLIPAAVTGREKVLIVEDHTGVQDYIGNTLEDYYRILKAINGKEGLQVARDKMPDLIITDVMMPEMDGFTFCREVKKDVSISHIPVILVTARAGQEDKMEGLETGADDFLTKPFDSIELVTRVKNLLEQRRRLREHYMNEPNLQLSKITTTSVDERFLSQLKSIIENNLSDAGLDVEYLTRQMGSSYAHIYRKIKALTGLSPVAFIRLVRLTKARELLKNNHGNISEVAFEVGFESLQYFSRCFSRQYGISPSVFLKQHHS